MSQYCNFTQKGQCIGHCDWLLSPPPTKYLVKYQITHTITILRLIYLTRGITGAMGNTLTSHL